MLCLARTDRHVNGCKIEETAVSVSVCLFPSVECQSALSTFPLVSVLSTRNVQMPKPLFQFPVFKQIVSAGLQGCRGRGLFHKNLINCVVHSHTFYNDTLFVWTVAYQWGSSSFCFTMFRPFMPNSIVGFHSLSYIAAVSYNLLFFSFTLCSTGPDGLLPRVGWHLCRVSKQVCETPWNSGVWAMWAVWAVWAPFLTPHPWSGLAVRTTDWWLITG